MGFFDEGGVFGDAFSGITGLFDTSANAAPGPAMPSPDMPIPQDPNGGLADAAGINDIGSQPANVPLPRARPDMTNPGTTGLPGSDFAGPPAMMAPGGGGGGAAPPLPPPQTIPTSTGPTPIASSTSAGGWGPTNAQFSPAPARPQPGGGGGLFDNIMQRFGKNPDTPFGSTLFGDPRTARQMMGSLGAGLSAAGNSAGKSPMQAAFGGAGAAIQGGQKADDTGTAEQRKDTDQALNKARLDETRRRNDQMYQVYQDRLKKAQQVGTVQSRAQAWENSDLGKLQKANTEILKRQAEIRQSYRDDLRAAANSGLNGNDIRGQMKKEMDDAQAEVYGQYGIDPKNINKIQSMGTDAKNPHKPTSWDEFHSTVKPGQFYINPADGKTYQRKSAAPAPIDAGGTITAQPNFMSPNSGYSPNQGYADAA
jgi:hypothetical protein